MLGSILFILPLLIGYIATRMIVNEDAFSHAEQEDIKATLRAIQARLDGDPD